MLGKWWRLGGLLGIAFIVVWLPAFITKGDTPVFDDPIAETRAWIYDAALGSPNGLLHLEHAMYFATGVALWWCVFQDEPHELGAGSRAAYVFAGFVVASPIGLVMDMKLLPVSSRSSRPTRT